MIWFDQNFRRLHVGSCFLVSEVLRPSSRASNGDAVLLLRYEAIAWNLLHCHRPAYTKASWREDMIRFLQHFQHVRVGSCFLVSEDLGRCCVSRCCWDWEIVVEQWQPFVRPSAGAFFLGWAEQKYFWFKLYTSIFWNSRCLKPFWEKVSNSATTAATESRLKGVVQRAAMSVHRDMSTGHGLLTSDKRACRCSCAIAPCCLWNFKTMFWNSAKIDPKGIKQHTVVAKGPPFPSCCCVN